MTNQSISSGSVPESLSRETNINVLSSEPSPTHNVSENTRNGVDEVLENSSHRILESGMNWYRISSGEYEGMLSGEIQKVAQDSEYVPGFLQSPLSKEEFYKQNPQVSQQQDDVYYAPLPQDAYSDYLAQQGLYYRPEKLTIGVIANIEKQAGHIHDIHQINDPYTDILDLLGALATDTCIDCIEYGQLTPFFLKLDEGLFDSTFFGEGCLDGLSGISINTEDDKWFQQDAQKLRSELYADSDSDIPTSEILLGHFFHRYQENISTMRSLYLEARNALEQEKNIGDEKIIALCHICADRYYDLHTRYNFLLRKVYHMMQAEKNRSDYEETIRQAREREENDGDECDDE